MKDQEKVLIEMLKVLDQNGAAVMLEMYIARYGPLTDEAGQVVKDILSAKW